MSSKQSHLESMSEAGLLIPTKPKVPIAKRKPLVKGPIDSNIFAVMGAASQALKRMYLTKDSEEMCARVFEAGSYDEALAICSEYVTFDI